MTNSENIIRFGPNAYAKPATALNILRETVMGRELFDYAFKEYSRRWAFKHPTPADFFRTMEDASAVDLDWFWRGWFYSTEAVDIALNKVRYFQLDTKNPEVENVVTRNKALRDARNLSQQRNLAAGVKSAIEQDTSLLDFYNKWDRYAVTASSKAEFEKFYSGLSPAQQDFYKAKTFFYELEFQNLGGLVMPLVLEWTFTDGTTETERISAYIWRKNEQQVTKVFAKSKEVKSVKLDPNRETADIDETNNTWPREQVPSKFELFREQRLPRGSAGGQNPMQLNRQENNTSGSGTN